MNFVETFFALYLAFMASLATCWIIDNRKKIQFPTKGDHLQNDDDEADYSERGTPECRAAFQEAWRKAMQIEAGELRVRALKALNDSKTLEEVCKMEDGINQVLKQQREKSI